MHIDVAPETERLVREQISSGHFRSVDELITAGVQAVLEKNMPSPGETAPQTGQATPSGSPPASQAKNLVELFEKSPFKGLNIEFERDRDFGREIDL